MGDPEKRNAELARICDAIAAAVPNDADPNVIVDALALVFVSLGRQVQHPITLVQRVTDAINTLSRAKELRADLDAAERVTAARNLKPPAGN